MEHMSAVAMTAVAAAGPPTATQPVRRSRLHSASGCRSSSSDVAPAQAAADGFQTAFWVAAAVALVGVVSIAVFVRRDELEAVGDVASAPASGAYRSCP